MELILTLELIRSYDIYAHTFINAIKWNMDKHLIQDDRPNEHTDDLLHDMEQLS